MFTKKTLISTLIAASALGAAALPLPSSAASFDIFLSTSHARHDGYYNRDYGRHRYQGSRFDQDGDGIRNRSDRTPTGYGPRWDRDNDGIANRFDRTPNGAVRIRDRDRDGVPNRFDRYPDNPRWR